MDMGSVVTVASPTNRSAHVTVIGNDDMAAPGISLETSMQSTSGPWSEAWRSPIRSTMRSGVRRFMLREPSGRLVNVVSHRSG